ncbi:MAG: hypothetical protein KC994_00205 [Candidatus Omnitrophica bacterium]|nr:hypothetical protein [Candidatus Omnitrophota bacterium]
MTKTSESRLHQMLEEEKITKEEFEELRRNLPEPKGIAEDQTSAAPTPASNNASSTAGWYFLYRGLYYFFMIPFILAIVQISVAVLGPLLSPTHGERDITFFVSLLIATLINLLIALFFRRASLSCLPQRQ